MIDNNDRKAPAAFNDTDTLEVSRRIVREQGSIFRVNGREVRARDVTMLFADASTGSRSPALVHQGRIGEIIQARPDQRRRVLEEAAGISGLHARRHEAELRLKAAEQNLARVEDVIGQLAAQVASLKTQARQAVRYRNISGQVRRNEALLLHLRWIAAKRRSRRGRAAPRTTPCASSPRAPASRRRRPRARRRSPPGCRRCARPRPRPPRRCSASLSRATRSSARRRAPRSASPSSTAGSSNSPPTSSASARLPPTPRRRSTRLAAEEKTLKAEAQASAARLTGVNDRVAAADAALAASEKSFAELTGALADLTRAPQSAAGGAARSCAARGAA